MRPVPQTLFTQQQGNCLAACVASIFECSLEMGPQLRLDKGLGESMRSLLSWCLARGVTATLDFDTVAHLPPSYGYYVLIVQSQSPANRGGLHAVVANGVEIVHDPNPQVPRSNWTKYKPVGVVYFSPPVGKEQGVLSA